MILATRGASRRFLPVRFHACPNLIDRCAPFFGACFQKSAFRENSMSNNDDTWSPFFGSMQRRSLLKLFGTSAIAIAGSSALSLPALTQQRSDNPTDCAPPGVAGKTAVAFTPNPHLPVRTRKSAFELSNTEVDRLKSAYAALRKLTTQNPNDPRGWLRQGHVHCWYCGGGSNGREGEEIHGS